MNPRSEPALNIQDVPRLFSKYWPSIVISTVLGTVLFIAAANHMPKKYKSYFVLTIYGKYFQSPLVGDFVPELSDFGEARSQRESLIRQVLTPDYLDALGGKYGIYASNANRKPSSPWRETLNSHLKAWGEAFGFDQSGSLDSRLSAERQALRSRIEIISLSGTTFNVGFIYSDPDVAFAVTRDLYAQIIRNLLETRMRILANIRDAIQKRFSSLSVPTAAPLPPAPVVVTGHQMVQRELTEVRDQIRALTAEYTEEHPLIKQLRDRERILVSRMDNSPDAGPLRAPDRGKPSLDAGSGEGTRDIYGDLAKKLNYLNIAIDSDNQRQGDYFATLEPALYPSAPLWPKKGLMALWGMAFGLFGSLFVAALREYFHRSAIHAGALAHDLGIPLLGELPAFPSKADR